MSNKENIKMYELQNFGSKKWPCVKKAGRRCAFRPGVRVSRETALHKFKREGYLARSASFAANTSSLTL
jgi:hypothetical protein